MVDEFRNYSTSKGGFHLVDEIDISNYLYYGGKLGIITIPDDALIYLEEKKIKVNKLELNKVYDLKYYLNNIANEQIKLNFVKNNGLLIKYIVNPIKKIVGD